MYENALLYIILAALFAFAAAGYFYFFKSTVKTSLKWLLGILRFLTIFIILLLIFNPKFQKNTYFEVKPTLAIVVDNTKSISYLDKEKETIACIESLKNNAQLNKHFELSFFSFGEQLQNLDSLNFIENQTNIASPLLSLNEIYKQKTAPIVLLSDGNQTLGTNFEFIAQRLQQPVYTIVLGDTLQYEDIKISKINVNRYAYLKNQFPVEIFLNYAGDFSKNTRLTLKQGNTVVYQQKINFSPQETTQVLNFKLPANQVGIQKYTAHLEVLPNEKNSQNNTQYFAVEVIDQATNILLVSNLVHPDVGALKNAITSNEQRKLTVVTTQNLPKNLEDYQMIILYQPDNQFATIMDVIDRLQLNLLLVTGTKTNWNFLNSQQSKFSKNAYSNEKIQGQLNTAYSLFAVEDIGFSKLPPLETTLGTLTFKGSYEVLLQQNILGVTTQSPLLATFEKDKQRTALFDAENLWQWRANSYLKNANFKTFDRFVNSLVQYVSSNKRKTRLSVEAASFYYNNTPVKISAQYFDQNYIFNDKAALNIQIKNSETNQIHRLPLLLKSNFYEVNLSNLPAGNYSYTLTVANDNQSVSGVFSILDFNVEQQFLNANYKKLNYLSEQTNAKSYYIDNWNALVENLINDNRYTKIQKSEQKSVTLLDWKLLLMFLILLLSIEWFIRKYYGLI